MIRRGVYAAYVRTAASENIQRPECMQALGALEQLAQVSCDRCVVDENESSRCFFDLLNPVFNIVLSDSQCNNVVAQLPDQSLDPSA